MGIAISGSVGRDADNRKADTRKIQRLLNAVFPASRLEVDGIAGPRTVRRIERFQKRFMRRPDGRVDRDSRTLRRLNAAAPGLQKKWSGDSTRWSERKKLVSMDDRLLAKVVRVLEALESEGFRPRIVYAWRSMAEQQRLRDAGKSRVSFSFHNAQRKDGVPRACAADIVDRRWGWARAAETAGFWEALGRLAKAQGLYWGGDWRSVKDWAHVQLYPNARLAAIRRESGLSESRPRVRA